METFNILMFIEYPPFDKRAGGGQVVSWNTMKGLAERGHNIDVIIGRSTEELPEIPGVNFHIIPPFIGRRPLDIKFATLWWKKSLEFKDVDIIHGFRPEMVIANFYWKEIKNKTVIHEIHFPQLYPYSLRDLVREKYLFSHKAIRWSMYLHFDKYASMFSTKTITPSEYSKDKMVDIYKISTDKIIVIPNGVDKSVLKISKNRSLSHDSINLLFIGRLDPQKGVDILLYSFQEISNKYPSMYRHIKLTIIGDGPLRNQYEKLARRLDVIRNVKFLGRISQEEKQKYLAESDLLIVPSRSESFPLVVLEGMGAGLPVIGTSVGGISEQITDGETGVLIQPEDTKALANAIIKLLNAPEDMKRMGIAGRKRVEENFTWEKRVEKIEKVYKNENLIRA